MGKIWHALFLEADLGFVFGLGSWMGFVLLFCWFFKLFFCGLLVCLVCVDLFVFPTYCLLSVVFFFSLSFLIQLQLEVHEAKPVPENHPQWDTAIEGDEDQEDSEGFEDSFEEEEEEEEDDD